MHNSSGRRLNSAQIYSDSKAFVDELTVGTANRILADFHVLHNASMASTIGDYSNVTYGALEVFVENDFVCRSHPLFCPSWPGFLFNRNGFVP